MKKNHFNILVIIFIAAYLLIFSTYNLLEKSAKFMSIPLLALYYLGQYSERKFKN